MKYLNIILTIIAVLLLSITFRLIGISAVLTIANQNNQAILNLTRELISTNHRLEKKFSDMGQAIEKLNNQRLLKEGRGAADAK